MLKQKIFKYFRPALAVTSLSLALAAPVAFRPSSGGHSAKNFVSTATAADSVAKTARVDAALATIRSLSAATRCADCHTPTMIPFNSVNRDIALEVLKSNALTGVAPKATRLYVRSQKGESHASNNIILNPTGWESAITALIAAVNSPDTPNDPGDDGTGIVKVDCARAMRRLSMRLTGETVSPGDADWDRLQSFCKENKLEEAAHLLTGKSGFATNTLLQFSAPMQWSTQRMRDLPMLTMTGSMIIGVIRDDHNISDILTSDYFYNVEQEWEGPTFGYKDRFTFRKVNVPIRRGAEKAFSAIEKRTDLSNPGNLFQTSRGRPFYNLIRYSIRSHKRSDDAPNDVHTRNPGDSQNYTGYEQDLPDNDHNAGVLAMEGFASNYLNGTNRRAIQMLVNQYWCLPLDSIRNANVSEDWIGRDVTRNPLGPGTRDHFNANCKTCHGVMDGLRGAFYHFDRSNDADDMITGIAMRGSYAFRSADPRAKYDDKYFRNLHVAPEGRLNAGNEWEANFSPEFMTKVDWSQNRLRGKGVHDLAEAWVDTRQFYACMVKKATDLVCPTVRGSAFADDRMGFEGPIGKSAHDELVTELRRDKKMKKIFEKIAVNPACLGEVTHD